MKLVALVLVAALAGALIAVSASALGRQHAPKDDVVTAVNLVAACVAWGGSKEDVATCMYQMLEVRAPGSNG